MSENPYASPASDPLLELPFDGAIVPAERGERFVASFIDGLVAVAFGFPITWLFAKLHQRFVDGVTPSETSWYEQPDYGYGWSTAEALVAFVCFIAVHWIFLSRTGQTIGKKVMNIRIATMDGKRPPMSDLLLKRYGFGNILPLVPVVGPYLSVIDVLMIFGKQRRCLHDFVAATQVVKFRGGDVIPS